MCQGDLIMHPFVVEVVVPVLQRWLLPLLHELLDALWHWWLA